MGNGKWESRTDSELDDHFTFSLLTDSDINTGFKLMHRTMTPTVHAFSCGGSAKVKSHPVVLR